MDKSEARKFGDDGLNRIKARFELQLDTIYETPGFDADGFTDFFQHDVLTLDYPKSDAKRAQWVDLLGELQKAPTYVAFVRLQTTGLPRGIEEVYPGKKALQNAWIRIYRDLTPDKFQFTQRDFSTNMGDEVAIERASVIEIDHPSTVFIKSGHPLAGMPIEDEPRALFAIKGGTPAYQEPGAWERLEGEVNEWDIDFVVLTGQSVQDIEDKLVSLGHEQNILNNSLWSVMAEHRDYVTWAIDEAQKT